MQAATPTATVNVRSSHRGTAIRQSVAEVLTGNLCADIATWKRESSAVCFRAGQLNPRRGPHVSHRQ